MGKRIDYTGHKQNKFTVIGDSGDSVKGEKLWLCECECGERFKCKSSNIKRGRKACSTKCARDYLKPISDETRQKMSKAKLGKYRGKNSHHWKGGKNRCIDCGKMLSNRYGKRCTKHNIEHSLKDKDRGRKISKTMKGKLKTDEHIANVIKGLNHFWTDEKRLSISGKNSHNWKGGGDGKTHRGTKYKIWRSAVHKTCDYTCQACGQVGGELQAHHIESYKNKRKRYDVENGVSLCKKCHREFHNLYGIIKFKPTDFIDFVLIKNAR